MTTTIYNFLGRGQPEVPHQSDHRLGHVDGRTQVRRIYAGRGEPSARVLIRHVGGAARIHQAALAAELSEDQARRAVCDRVQEDEWVAVRVPLSRRGEADAELGLLLPGLATDRSRQVLPLQWCR